MIPSPLPFFVPSTSHTVYFFLFRETPFLSFHVHFLWLGQRAHLHNSKNTFLQFLDLLHNLCSFAILTFVKTTIITLTQTNIFLLWTTYWLFV